MRFFFGPRGELCAEMPPMGPLREVPAQVQVDPDVSTEELFKRLESLFAKGGRASEAERRGRYFGVRNVYPDGSFDTEERHYMEKCGCRVINTRIVQWCPEHDAYYSRVLSSENYHSAEQDRLAQRWDGVISS